VPRSSISLVLGFTVTVRVKISLLHLRTTKPSDYWYTID